MAVMAIPMAAPVVVALAAVWLKAMAMVIAAVARLLIMGTGAIGA